MLLPMIFRIWGSVASSFINQSVIAISSDVSNPGVMDPSKSEPREDDSRQQGQYHTLKPLPRFLESCHRQLHPSNR